jgi:hypothetical protein
MIIKKYNSFLLESLLLESQFIIESNFREIITQIKNENWGTIEGKVAEFILDVVGEELDLVYNYISDTPKPGLVSFIPEDKIDFSQVSIDPDRIIRPDHNDNLIKAYGIPFKGLVSNLYGTVNDFKLLKVIDSDGKISNDKYRVRGHYFYYLQNNKEPEKFVAVYRAVDSTKVVFVNIPETRRSEVKLGRFVNKLVDIYSKSDALKNSTDMDAKYQVHEVPFFDFTASDIEKFVNVYSAKILFEQNALERFKVVSGEEIRKWYDEKNYSGANNGAGQLNNSCMRHSRCQKYFDIYVDNPKVCQLLILMDSTGKKIDGRAILWKTESGENFMDRVYTSKDSYMKLFKQWSEHNNYRMRSSNYRSDDIVVKVKPKIYSYYPYMDTLSCYAPVKGILSNDRLDYGSYPDLKLDRTILSRFKDIFPPNPNDSIVFNLFKKRGYKYGTPVFSLASVSGEARPY